MRPGSRGRIPVRPSRPTLSDSVIKSKRTRFSVHTGQPLHDELGNERRIAERPPSAGVEDLVIVPLVVIALAISKLLKAMFSVLIYVLDYAVPILLQLMRIPLLAAQLLGDGMELLLGGVLWCLPVS